MTEEEGNDCFMKARLFNLIIDRVVTVVIVGNEMAAGDDKVAAIEVADDSNTAHESIGLSMIVVQSEGENGFCRR